MDCFEILTTSGVVLYQKSYAPIPNVINSLIKDIFIEEKVSPNAQSYRKDKYTLKWAVSDLGLIFVVSLAIMSL
jgi:signal recognition particle receptor subunit alpha